MPSGYCVYHQAQHSHILRSAHTVEFICFAWKSEESSTIFLYSINFFSVIETVCLLRGTDVTFKYSLG